MYLFLGGIRTRGFVQFRLFLLFRFVFSCSQKKVSLCLLEKTALKQFLPRPSAGLTNKKTPPCGEFFCWSSWDKNPRKSGFDKEEQARRKYRRTCDDAAAQSSGSSQPNSALFKATFGWLFLLFCKKYAITIYYIFLL